MASNRAAKGADPEDFLSDSLQTLYDYTPITYSSAGSVFQYRPSAELVASVSQSMSCRIEPFTITLVTPTTQAGNWALHASSIWASSLFLADHLSDLHLDQRIIAARDQGRSNLRLLELGAGAGLPSIVIAKMFEAVTVIVSDYPDEELIQALASNVQSNDVAQRCRAVPYAWGTDTSVLHPITSGTSGVEPSDRSFDIVVAADTLWNSESHSLFLQALQQTLRRSEDARIYLVAGLHTGRYTIHAFVQAAPAFGFAFAELMEREVAGSTSRSWDIERHESEDDKERRRWIVWMVLKWKS